MKTQKGIVQLRIDQRVLAAFDEKCAARGLVSRNDAMRLLIIAWLHNPGALPVGLPILERHGSNSAQPSNPLKPAQNQGAHVNPTTPPGDHHD